MTQRDDSVQLGERTQQILRLLIRTHITSGEPVGSGTLSRNIEGKLSPATIRNIMAELEEAGYLTHPHTSAGRVPSEKGYRFYVDSLADSGKVSKSSERMIAQMLEESDTPEDMMSRASFLLSAISRNIGIVIAPPLAATQLKHIEFLELGDGKLLVIFVSSLGSLQRKVIRIQDSYSQEELDRAGRFLVEKFWGRTLIEIRNELLKMMEAERSAYDRMLNLLRTWHDSLEAEQEPAPDSVFVQGTANILSQPEFADVERMKNLFQMFEEKSKLVRILNECISSSPATGVKIAIGSELGIPSMRGFTVITASYPSRDKSAGYLGIIGPTRMEYERGISVVAYLGRLVGERINA
jgi:heat-inducible transcriptional repressor